VKVDFLTLFVNENYDPGHKKQSSSYNIKGKRETRKTLCQFYCITIFQNTMNLKSAFLKKMDINKKKLITLTYDNVPLRGTPAPYKIAATSASTVAIKVKL
jgi:hypothetical protein